MTKSFYMVGSDTANIVIDEIHVNLWVLKRDLIICDFGVQFLIDHSFLEGANPFELTCGLPFAFKPKSLLDLHEKMKDDGIMRLVFNDDLLETKSVAVKSNIPRPPLVCKLRSRGEVLFSDCEIAPSNDSNHKVNINIRRGVLDRDKIKDIFKEDKIKLYIRFRCQIDVKKDNNLFYVNRMFHNQFYFDFRFNEERLLDNTDELNNILQINRILIFIINPTHYKIVLEPGERRYARLLETNNNDWPRYLPELDKMKDRFIIYSYREGKSLTSDSKIYSHYKILIALEAEKASTQLQLNLLSTVVFISAFFILIPQIVNIEEMNSLLISVILFVYGVLGLIGVSSGSILVAITINIFSNFIYYRFFQNKK